MLNTYNAQQTCQTCNCCLPETTTTNMRQTYQKHKTKIFYFNPVSFRRKIIENYSKLLLIVIIVFLYVISNVTIVHAESVTKLYDYDSESSLNYETYNCSNCYVAEAREEKKKYTLHLIKQQILSKMGLEQVPNITRSPTDIPPSIRKFMTAFDKLQSSSSSSAPLIRHNKHWHHQAEDNVEDDDHIKSQAMVFLAAPCKYYFLILFNLIFAGKSPISSKSTFSNELEDGLRISLLGKKCEPSFSVPSSSF